MRRKKEKKILDPNAISTHKTQHGFYIVYDNKVVEYKLDGVLEIIPTIKSSSELAHIKIHYEKTPVMNFVEFVRGLEERDRNRIYTDIIHYQANGVDFRNDFVKAVGIQEDTILIFTGEGASHVKICDLKKHPVKMEIDPVVKKAIEVIIAETILKDTIKKSKDLSGNPVIKKERKHRIKKENDMLKDGKLIISYKEWELEITDEAMGVLKSHGADEETIKLLTELRGGKSFNSLCKSNIVNFKKKIKSIYEGMARKRGRPRKKN